MKINPQGTGEVRCEKNYKLENTTFAKNPSATSIFNQIDMSDGTLDNALDQNQYELFTKRMELENRLNKLNKSTAPNRWEGDNERFGEYAINEILTNANTLENIQLINNKLDELEKNGNIWAYDIIELFNENENTDIRQDNTANSFFKAIYTNKSINPDVIALETEMSKMGYEVSFADNLEVGLLITEAYKKMHEKGFKLPKQIILMEPTNEGVLGYRPYSNDSNRMDTPIYFSINLAEKRENMEFLPNIKYNSTDDPIGIIYHEIGHFLHEEHDLNVEDANQIWQDFANDGYDTELAEEVGYYAMTGDKFHTGKEFVAEVFAGLMCGKTYSAKVMNIYEKLNGPKVN